MTMSRRDMHRTQPFANQPTVDRDFGKGVAMGQAPQPQFHHFGRLAQLDQQRAHSFHQNPVSPPGICRINGETPGSAQQKCRHYGNRNIGHPTKFGGHADQQVVHQKSDNEHVGAEPHWWKAPTHHPHGINSPPSCQAVGSSQFASLPNFLTAATGHDVGKGKAGEIPTNQASPNQTNNGCCNLIHGKHSEFFFFKLKERCPYSDGLPCVQRGVL